MHISTNDLHCCKPARLLQLEDAHLAAHSVEFARVSTSCPRSFSILHTETLMTKPSCGILHKASMLPSR